MIMEIVPISVFQRVLAVLRILYKQDSFFQLELNTKSKVFLGKTNCSPYGKLSC